MFSPYAHVRMKKAQGVSSTCVRKHISVTGMGKQGLHDQSLRFQGPEKTDRSICQQAQLHAHVHDVMLQCHAVEWAEWPCPVRQSRPQEQGEHESARGVRPSREAPENSTVKLKVPPTHDMLSHYDIKQRVGERTSTAATVERRRRKRLVLLARHASKPGSDTRGGLTSPTLHTCGSASTLWLDSMRRQHTLADGR
jgi:hypothetical protein